MEVIVGNIKITFHNFHRSATIPKEHLQRFRELWREAIETSPVIIRAKIIEDNNEI